MIVIFRHGETEANQQHRLQGITDSPLTEIGKLQVKLAAKHYLTNYHDCNKESQLFSSDIGRSIQSAEIFSKIVKPSYAFQCESLRERSWGDLDGVMGYPSPDLRLKNYIKLSEGCEFTSTPPHGESVADLYERVSRLLDVNRIRYDDPNIIRIYHVHSFTSRVLRGIFLKASPEVWLAFDNPHTIYFVFDGIKYFGVQP